MIWRIGILYRMVELLELVCEQPILKSEIITSFASSRFRNVSVEEVLDICFFGEWISINDDGQVICTEDGSNLLEIDSAQDRLKKQIERLLANENPLWAPSAVQGRRALANYAPPEVVQCFREAGLLENENDDVVAWWDKLACQYRAAQDQVYVEIGRKGEKLTFESETIRTGLQPKWTALEYSNAGYDILSCISASDKNRLVIEVKTTIQPWDRANFFLSRAEWDTLILEKHAVIHLWSIEQEKPLHYSIQLDELQGHIPSDCGNGKWHKCCIPFGTFSPQETAI